MSAPRVAIVGGGVTGLVAAYALRGAADLTLLEASRELGGKVRTVALDGTRIDVGPDGFLARKPEAAALCAELGLAGALVGSAAVAPLLWIDGRLRPLPEGLALGVPVRLRSLASTGILSPSGALRAAADLVLPARAADRDESVGALVRRRLGAEVRDRLVDPLVGGVYAGRVDELSARATAPALVEAERRSGSLIRGLAALPRPSAGPTFLTLRGGLGRLIDALSGALAAADLCLGSPVERILRAPGGRYTVVARDGAIEADAVVVATPAFATAALIEALAPEAAQAVRECAYASVATVTLRYPKTVEASIPAASGFVVPSGEGRLVTACTFTSRKWPHLAPADGSVLLRCSVGRAGDARWRDLDDAQLVERVHAELAVALRLSAAPLAARVDRWERALPQYGVGHLDRLERIARDLTRAPGIVLAGAAYGGIGIPDCVRQAMEAANEARGILGSRPA